MNKALQKKEIKIQLTGTPEEIAPHIVGVAEEFQSDNLKYHAQEKSYKSNQYSKHFEILCGDYFGPQIWWIGGDEEESPKHQSHKVGTIILRALRNRKTLLISKPELSGFDSDGSYFNSFLKRLLTELKQLGFVETWPKKAWYIVKEIIGIAKVVKP